MMTTPKHALSICAGSIFSLTLTLFVSVATAATFTNSGISFPGIKISTTPWGDYDGDGRLDLFMNGTATNDMALTQLWRNTGAEFVNTNTPFPDVYNSCALWGDYDNDGRLDLLLTGEVPPSITQLWRNTGNGFSNVNAAFPGISLGSAAWADFDNDGKLDLLLSGNSSQGAISQIWRNTGQEFVNVNAGLPGLFHSSVSVGDFDNDGFVDILLVGNSGMNLVSQIWHNTGNGFTNINAGLPGVSYPAAAWGDFDNDGRLDVLLMGQGDTNFLTQVWRNTGNSFTNINAGLPAGYLPSVAWGDFDNDGRLDILLTGKTKTSFVTEVWRNTGASFTNIGAGLPSVYCGSAVWVDYNNDGCLDIFFNGYTGNLVTNSITQLWLNAAAPSNHPPTAPAALTSQPSQAGVRLSWAAAVDSETPATGLTYNVRVGTAPGGNEILSAHSTSNGTRLIPAMGNCFHRTFLVLTNLAQGTYYWSVQAIDTAFAGSAFAAEKTFTIGTGPTISIVQPEAQTVIVQGDGTSGTIYTLENSSNLTNWTTAGSLTADSNGQFRYTNSSAIAHQFYRVRQP